jgi:hypothetical protein
MNDALPFEAGEPPAPMRLMVPPDPLLAAAPATHGEKSLGSRLDERPREGAVGPGGREGILH